MVQIVFGFLTAVAFGATPTTKLVLRIAVLFRYQTCLVFVLDTFGAAAFLLPHAGVDVRAAKLVLTRPAAVHGAIERGDVFFGKRVEIGFAFLRGHFGGLC